MDALTVARIAAAAAGDVLTKGFRDGVRLRSKSATYDLVSDADINAERVISDMIRTHFPDHHILGEEEQSADVTAEHLWIVDPLDGTTNFAHGIPHCATSIAYYVSGKPWVAVIHNPLTNDWYTASAGCGAFHNDRRIQVAEHTSLNEAIIGTGFYYDRGAMMEQTLASIGNLFRQKIHGIRRFGTASLDLAAVACGQFSAYFEYQLAPWDFAAGRLLVTEAGGRVTTCDQETLPLASTSVLASNGALHEFVAKQIQRPKDEGNLPDKGS